MPFQIWITSSLLLLLIYGTYVPPDSTSKFWWLARTLRPAVFPDWFFPPIWAFVYIAHAGEGVYATTLARKHHMPWHIAVSVP
jgi:tryptophan-rich sensory protein